MPPKSATIPTRFLLIRQPTAYSTSLYSKSLNEFFADSESLDGIPLSTLPAGETTTYSFKVCFDAEAGNNYQNGKTIFDLIFGEVISPLQLPPECLSLTGIISQKIEGNESNDHIRGTSVPELILGYGGNDYIDGGGGDDCIVGGNGNDQIDGGSGNDVIVAGEGNDRVKKSSGDDLIYGGSGNDKLEGGSGNDYLDGQDGNDELFGGSGTDTCVNGKTLHTCEI